MEGKVNQEIRDLRGVGSKMTREVMKEGVPKDRSVSSDRVVRERERGLPARSLMSVRNAVKGGKWSYFLLGMLVVFAIVSLVLHFPSFGACLQNSGFVESTGRLNVNSMTDQVTKLSSIITDILDKVDDFYKEFQQVADRKFPSSRANVIGQLKLERQRSLNFLVEVSTELEGVARRLTVLQKEFTVGNGQEADHGKHSKVEIQEPLADSESDDLEDDPLIDFFEREEIRKYIKVSGSPLPPSTILSSFPASFKLLVQD